jgi:hypothetical protein
MFCWLLFISGCPWGDEYTDCTQSHCTSDFSKCCQTCTPTTTAIYTTASAKSSRVQVSPALLFCLYLYQFYSWILSIRWYIYFNCTGVKICIKLNHLGLFIAFFCRNFPRATCRYFTFFHFVLLLHFQSSCNV